MPAWLLAALRMLAAGGLFAGGTELAQQAITGGQGAFVDGSPFRAIAGDALSGFPHPHKRRRRRRALTASDKVDIAFIASILGKPAGKDVAAIIAART